MKKLALTLAIVLGMSFAASAQNGGGLFGYGETNDTESTRDGATGSPGIPGHGEEGDQDAPLGSGALLLLGFGAAYALKKNKK